MDLTLLKKMDVYPTDAEMAGLIPEASSGETTLIKADISLFHDAAPLQTSIVEELCELSEPPEISEYDMGFQEGQAKADIVYQDTIKVMQAALDKFQAELSSMAQHIEQSHLSALTKCLGAVFPRLMQGGTDLELQTLLQGACNSALNGQIQLNVHPDDQAYCEHLCADKDIIIEADESLTPLQMRLQWAGGGADIDCKSVAETCLSHLDAASHQPGRKLDE